MWLVAEVEKVLVAAAAGPTRRVVIVIVAPLVQALAGDIVVVAGKAIEQAAESAPPLGAVGGAAAVAIEDVEKLVEHGRGKPFARSRAYKNPGSIQMDVSQGLTGETNLAASPGVGYTRIDERCSLPLRGSGLLPPIDPIIRNPSKNVNRRFSFLPFRPSRAD